MGLSVNKAGVVGQGQDRCQDRGQDRCRSRVAKQGSCRIRAGVVSCLEFRIGAG